MRIVGLNPSTDGFGPRASAAGTHRVNLTTTGGTGSIEVVEFLERLKEDWEPISKLTSVAWTVFYLLFLVYAAVNNGKFLLPDYVFLPIHEGGHLLFGWFGETLGVMGGTLLQLFVPLAIAVYFILRRQIPGTAFAAFFFFENFLNVATYMADARRQQLPLVTAGDADYVEQDWTFMFGKVGLLEHDTSIAAVVRVLGWLGMIGVVVWLGWRSRASLAGARSQKSGVGTY